VTHPLDPAIWGPPPDRKLLRQARRSALFHWPVWKFKKLICRASDHKPGACGGGMDPHICCKRCGASLAHYDDPRYAWVWNAPREDK
jgi:hypothetical protein